MTHRAIAASHFQVERRIACTVGGYMLLGMMLGGCGGTSKEPRPEKPDADTIAVAKDAAMASSPDSGVELDGGGSVNSEVSTNDQSGNTLEVTLELSDAASDAGAITSDAQVNSTSDAGPTDDTALPDDAALPGDAALPDDAALSNDNPFDAAIDAAASEADGGCVPSNPATEVCDGFDNDCNGLVDDVDALEDGIFDCLQVALFGNAGQLGSADFVAWLGQQGPTGVTRIQTDQSELTGDSIAGFSIIVLDRLVRTYTEQEAQVLATWVEQGGGLIVMTGYASGNPDVDYPNSLLTPYNVGFASALQSGPITMFTQHATVAELTSVTFSGGHEVLLDLPDASTAMFESVATLPSGDVGAAAGVYGAGRIFLWGDEWIEFDSEWSSQPDVTKLWANVTSWVAHLSN